jgi:rubrerythrin
MQNQATSRGASAVLDRPAGKSGTSPVDDRMYNVMQALVSKLEAIEAYEMYADDDGGHVFQELIADERRHAERLLEELRSCLAGR